MPEVYHSFVKYADKPIPYIGHTSKLEFVNGRFDYSEQPLTVYSISQEDMVLIDKVLVSIMHYEAWFLAARTMEEEP